MGIQTGDIAPDFEQDTLNGSIRFHEWMGRSWCVLFSQPGQTGSELAQMARLKPEWNRRGVKVVGLAVDQVEMGDGFDQDGWALNFPVIADADRSVSSLYGAATRSVYVIDPDKKVRLVRTYPSGTACDFNEMLSLVDSLQLGDALLGGRDLRN